jgi:hypothetical protein
VDYLNGTSLLTWILIIGEPFCGERQMRLWKNQRDSSMRITRLIIAGFEDTGWNHKSRNAGGLWKQEKGKKYNLV